MCEDGSNLSVKMRGVLQFCWFIVLPLFSLRMSDGDLMFTKEPDDPSYFKRGSNATLVWDYTDPQNTLTGIVWSVKIGETFFGVLGRTGGNVTPHSEMPAIYSGRVFVVGRASLVIRNITLQDSTEFGCRLIGNPETSSTVSLIVADPPVISKVLVNASYNEGSQVSIRCQAAGTPDPDVTWIWNGQEESTGKNSAVLTFNSINRTDVGQYTCKANNSAGSNEEQITLVVYYPAIVISYSPNNTKSWIGQTVKFKCVSDGVPTPAVTCFKRDAEELQRVTAKENTVVVNITTDGDFGDYECIADNGFSPAGTATVTVQQIKQPGAPEITSSDADIQATSLTVKWSEPTDNGGSPITAYRVVIMSTGTDIRSENITDPSTTSRSIQGLNKGTQYTVKVFARNLVFEGPAGSKIVETNDQGPANGPEAGGRKNEGIDTAIIAGAAAAGALFIIGVVILIVLWRRRKASHLEETARDELGGGNTGEPDEGYASVSRAAAQSLGADGPTAAVNYAVVDPSKKKKNRQPAVSIEYAQVDPSKKVKKNKKKKPGDLDYAELGDFRPEYPTAAAAQPAAAVAPPAASRRPPTYEHTEYADIAQFGVPQPDPTYANVSKKDDVVYSNVESM